MTDRQGCDGKLMTIFLAGHETTANALSWTIILVSQHPEIEKKLFEEINSLIGNRPPSSGEFMK
ncbi:cytochrome P450 [Peribacillus loiseleuriae]|uniref:cytochrome P450 n=1 Tax=Peribacillus loiseleuriae TaxID=1679170 RepID=UPI003D05ADED